MAAGGMVMDQIFGTVAGLAGAHASRKSQERMAKRAAAAEIEGIQMGIDAQREMYERAIGLEAPFTATKMRGLAGMEALMTGGFRGYESPEAYAAGLEERYGTGLRGLEESEATELKELEAKYGKQERERYEETRKEIEAEFGAPRKGVFGKAFAGLEGRELHPKVLEQQIAARLKEKYGKEAVTDFGQERQALEESFAERRGILEEEYEQYRPEIEAYKGFDPQLQGLSPLEQVQQQAGEKAIERSLAARGQFFSGAGLERLGEFNRRLLAESGQRQFGRYQALAGLAPVGGAGQYSMQLGAGLAGAYGGIGQAGAGALQTAGQLRGAFYSGLGEFGQDVASAIGGRTGSDIGGLRGAGTVGINGSSQYSLGSPGQFQLQTAY